MSGGNDDDDDDDDDPDDDDDDVPDDDDEDVPVRPLVASAPITMHAAPGVPAAIFQAPV